MKKLLFSTLLIFPFTSLYAQRMVPAPSQTTPVAITGGTIHTGNGQVVENGVIVFVGGKITYAGSSSGAPSVSGMQVINAQGKQIYPGLIAPNSQLGLNEIELVRSTNDYTERGTYNPCVRSLIAYNTDSKVIPTVRSNGILLTQIVPVGGIVSGTSSIVQLDAWNWEDAQYKPDNGLHLNWPGFFKFNFENNVAAIIVNPDYEKQVMEIRQYFSQSSAYSQEASSKEININFEAMKGLFTQGKTLFVHCDYVREIINACQFAKDFNLRLVIVGGRDSYLCTDVLKQNNTAVILGNVHSLPGSDDVQIEIPYETAALLNKAGVLYCLSIGGYWQLRNLPFMAGTTVAQGLSKEDALKSVTSNTAKILGIDAITGTLEAGKDANIIISSGDVLDMMSSNIEYAFIQGRQIDLDNSQKQLYDIYRQKYGLK